MEEFDDATQDQFPGAAGIELVQELRDLSPVYESQLSQNTSTGKFMLAVGYSPVFTRAVYFDINVMSINMTALAGTLTNESLSASYFLSSSDFWVTQGNGFRAPAFPATDSSPCTTARVVGGG
ncbi:hypothetical protein NEOLEDRAFT_673547 [Neolentinus lepideus HHB14362 ss-1]|uniref:Uncharacterized protein n=1 Tax=Neolentinus lepideus HHB14362 ss-1 TaxID=1314782 RepID=A0A165QBX4_9AGAM|nr:hypothetical protein NEOLEDRAFT_673547 [Neolentinus lepideus HHB14362 ss-1]